MFTVGKKDEMTEKSLRIQLNDCIKKSVDDVKKGVADKTELVIHDRIAVNVPGQTNMIRMAYDVRLMLAVIADVYKWREMTTEAELVKYFGAFLCRCCIGVGCFKYPKKGSLYCEQCGCCEGADRDLGLQWLFAYELGNVSFFNNHLIGSSSGGDYEGGSKIIMVTSGENVLDKNAVRANSLTILNKTLEAVVDEKQIYRLVPNVGYDLNVVRACYDLRLMLSLIPGLVNKTEADLMLEFADFMCRKCTKCRNLACKGSMNCQKHQEKVG